jgi:electron transfer flavoprotein alpha subunit
MSGCVLLIAEQRQGALNPVSLETMVAGQQLASALGAELVVALPGAGATALAAEFSAYQASRLLAVEHAALEPYGPDAYTAVAEHLVRELQPAWVLFPHTYQVRDFAPSVAARFERSLISDCVAVSHTGGELLFERQVFQGKLHADVAPLGDGPHFASFQAAAFSSDALQPAASPVAVETLSPELAVAARVSTEAPEREGGQVVDLSSAEIIVSVGRGIQDEGNIDVARELAEAIGGEIAASRPVCDEGWIPIERQVGSSGQSVAPKLYLALGISGASQHLVGMKGARTIVAVNKDPKAPIFKVADYGIVGDVLEVMPALISALKS